MTAKHPHTISKNLNYDIMFFCLCALLDQYLNEFDVFAWILVSL